MFQAHCPEALLMFANLARILTELREKKKKKWKKIVILGFHVVYSFDPNNFHFEIFGFIRNKKQANLEERGQKQGEGLPLIIINRSGC